MIQKNYKDLEVYKVAFDLYIKTHRFSLCLPKFEQFELGNQLRRSSDSVVSNIVEGYGRRRYKSDFIRFIIYSKASNDETKCHLEKLNILYPEFAETTSVLLCKYDKLGAMLHAFFLYIEKQWKC